MASTLNADNGVVSGSAGLKSSADSTGVLALQTNGTTAVTISTTQQVGIGTTSPSAPLAIGRVNSAEEGGQLDLCRASDNASSWGIDVFGSTSTPSLRFIDNVASATRMLIDGSGNVGIGNSSPAARVDAFRSTVGTYFLGGGGDNVARQLAIKSSTTTNSGDTHTFDAQSGTGILAFAIAGAEKSRIDTSGNLLVGDTTAGQTSGYGIKITPAGDGANYPRISLVTAATTNGQSNGFSLYSVGAAAWRFYVGAGGTISATSTTITGISDQRLKENIRDLDDGLEKVMALQPRKFDWKEGKGQDIKNARGFIAQEFEEVFPDMIEEWLDPAPEGEEPYKAVNANLIPTLVKAIQEQQAIIEQLRADVEILKGNV